jgi:hypothetical protein
MTLENLERLHPEDVRACYVTGARAAYLFRDGLGAFPLSALGVEILKAEAVHLRWRLHG